MGNSVVYVPAYDAEIEYLESDGNSYIDTGLKASSELGILAHIRFPSTKLWLFGGANGLADREFGFLIDSTTLTSYRYGTHTVNLGGLSLNTTYEFDSTQNHNVMKVGSLTFTATASTFTSDYNLYLFTENRNGSLSGKSSGVRIYDFKIYQNSTLVRDFIPVRIGNVGYLYDKVTKQLFANKGTDNFVLGNDVSNAIIPQQRCVLYFGSQRSVIYERVYEEYEWLVGDGMAYIDTGHNVNEDLDYETKAHLLPSTYLFWYRTKGNTGDNTMVVRSDTNIHIGQRVANNSYDIRITDTDDAVEIKWDGEYVYINDTKYHVTKHIELNHNFNLFYIRLESSQSTSEYTSNNVKCAYFRFLDSNRNYIQNLIPCKLLQSIHATLDGNGIARQAGECGMWDKVSNRFYGNVASYGSFSVSND